jgi:hypothetical protein
MYPMVFQEKPSMIARYKGEGQEHYPDPGPGLSYFVEYSFSYFTHSSIITWTERIEQETSPF